MKFSWDRLKAETNLRKHRVTFDEATTAFRDPLASIFVDPDHSANEQREIIIGHSLSGNLLLVSFTERDDQSIRLISARMTDAQERRRYEEDR